MPTLAQLIYLLEASLVLTGLYLISRVITSRDRERWIFQPRLPDWGISLADFFLLIWLILLIPMVAHRALLFALPEEVPAPLEDPTLYILIFGFTFHGGSLLAWFLFYHYLRRKPEPLERFSPDPSPEVPALAGGGKVFLLALPVTLFTALIWTQLLRLFGLPLEQQDLVGVFAATESPALLAGLIFLAVVVAPINEELVFRAGLYRFARTRLPRSVALFGTSGLFALLHANWFSFGPLLVLGVLLCLAYERTGRISVPIIAHALFNLNTIVLIAAQGS